MLETLIATRKPYVSQVFLVIDHAIDNKVRVRLDDAEVCFSSIVSAEAKSTNLDPDAPPDAPRLTMSDNHKQISLAQSRMQLVLNFDGGFDIQKASQVIQKTAANFFNAASSFQPLDDKTRVGLIVHVNQPCESSKELMSQYLAAKLYSGKSLSTLSTFEIKLGFQTESNLYKNFSFNIYELREFKVPPGMQRQRSIMVNIESIPTTEVGIASILDINNRPRIGSKLQGVSVSFDQTSIDIVEGMLHMLQHDRHELLPLDLTRLKDSE